MKNFITQISKPLKIFGIIVLIIIGLILLSRTRYFNDAFEKGLVGAMIAGFLNLLYLIFKCIKTLLEPVAERVNDTRKEISDHLSGNDKMFNIHIYTSMGRYRHEKYRFDELPEKYKENINLNHDNDIYFYEKTIAGEGVVKYMKKEEWMSQYGQSMNI